MKKQRRVANLSFCWTPRSLSDDDSSMVSSSYTH